MLKFRPFEPSDAATFAGAGHSAQIAEVFDSWVIVLSCDQSGWTVEAYFTDALGQQALWRMGPVPNPEVARRVLSTIDFSRSDMAIHLDLFGAGFDSLGRV